jgi:hypothetical protein
MVNRRSLRDKIDHYILFTVGAQIQVHHPDADLGSQYEQSRYVV